MQGTVKWFNKDKGYGFLLGDDGKDYFVHYKEIVMNGYKQLEQGQQVKFLVTSSPKGQSATRVEVI